MLRITQVFWKMLFDLRNNTYLERFSLNNTKNSMKNVSQSVNAENRLLCQLRSVSRKVHLERNKHLLFLIFQLKRGQASLLIGDFK